MVRAQRTLPESPYPGAARTIPERPLRSDHARPMVASRSSGEPLRAVGQESDTQREAASDNKTPVAANPGNTSLATSPVMKDLKEKIVPILGTAAIVVAVLVIVFRWNPFGVKKAVTGA